MSGSHGRPEPPRDGRYGLEDTIYEMEPVTPAPAAPMPVLRMVGGKLYVDKVKIEAAADGHAPEAKTEPDCTVWPAKVDARLAALEAQVEALLMRLEDGK